jgi:hypothetical protein
LIRRKEAAEDNADRARRAAISQSLCAKPQATKHNARIGEISSKRIYLVSVIKIHVASKPAWALAKGQER